MSWRELTVTLLAALIGAAALCEASALPTGAEGTIHFDEDRAI
jgi:hypothetical protein